MAGRAQDRSPLIRACAPVPARCEGRGYFIRPPRDPSNWDVPTVRVECRGCQDCRPPATQLDRDVLRVLGTGIPASVRSATACETIVAICDPSEASMETARVTRQVAAILTAAGFDCARSRTRVSVMRAGTRPALGPPSTTTRRAR